MSTATYYQTLGVLASAPPEVIRAAYKALALVHHPDKTLHLPAGERVSHAKVFREVQEAYDVISIHSLKALYDAELARHNNSVDLSSSSVFSLCFSTVLSFFRS
jgi:DnaJ-class molecular chaperone